MSFCESAGITVPVVLAMADGVVTTLFMPRKWALSEWNRSPNVPSTKLPVLLELGTIVPGNPSLL